MQKGESMNLQTVIIAVVVVVIVVAIGLFIKNKNN